MIMEKVAFNVLNLIDLKNSTFQCHLGNLSEQQCPFIYKVGPVGGSYFGSVFSITQIICISNLRSLSLIVIILWLFEKYTLVNVTKFVNTL